MFSYGFLIDFQLSLIALWAVYFLVIHRRVPVKVSRAILLLIIPIALAVSTIKVPVLEEQSVYDHTQDITAVKAQVKQESVNELYMGYDDVIEQQPLVASSVSLPEVQVQVDEFSTWQIILSIYLCGVVLMFVWTTVGAAKLWNLIHRSKKEVIDGQEVIFTKKQISACSFFGYIIVNESYRGSQWLRSMVLHETLHSRCHHTVDLLYMIVGRALLWFNPVSWHMVKLVRQVHEYEVDCRVVDSGEPLNDYMTLLIDANFKQNPALCNSLSYSLTKKRLLMITKSYTKFSYMRVVAVAPVVGVLICIFVLTAKMKVNASVLSDTTALFVEEFKSSQLMVKDTTTIEYVGSVEYVDSAKVSSLSVSRNQLEPKPETSADRYTVKNEYFGTVEYLKMGTDSKKTRADSIRTILANHDKSTPNLSDVRMLM